MTKIITTITATSKESASKYVEIATAWIEKGMVDPICVGDGASVSLIDIDAGVVYHISSAGVEIKTR